MLATLTDPEAAAVAQAAQARGLRPSDFVRLAVLAFVDRPVHAADAAPAVLARLDTIAATLGQHVAELGRLVAATDDTLVERDEVRGMLADVANAVGILAGSLVLADDAGAEAVFGPERD